MNKKGMTLIETMIAISLSGFVGMGFYNYIDENTKRNNKNQIVNDIDSIMNAFDSRLDIDGYDVKHWNDKEWKNTEEVVSKLFGEEFQSKSANKCPGKWEPLIVDDKDINLISCNLWKHKLPMGLNTEADLKTDVNDFITQANVYLIPDVLEDYSIEKQREVFQEFNKTLMFLKGKNNKTKNGYVFYDFYSKKKEEYLSKLDCGLELADCSIKATYNRLGESEMLFTDGSNQMVDSTINYVEDNDSAPLQCVRWIKDNSDEWTLSSGNNDCGIGIYHDPSHPVLVEVGANNGTFSNIVLDKECTLYNWDSSSKTLSDSGILTPCGMHNDGVEVYQVIQNTNSMNSFIENVYVQDGKANKLKTTELITENISTNYMTIKNDIEVKAKAKIKNLNVKNNTNLRGDLNIHSALNILLDLQFHSNVFIDNELKIEGNLNVNNIETNKGNYNSLESLGNIRATNTKAVKSLNLAGVYSENQYCDQNGSISRDNEGELLNCVGNKWLILNKSDIIGTVMAWRNNTIPDGWLECNGQSTSAYPKLRSVVGNNVPDLRGNFVRGYQSNNGKIHEVFQEVLDKNRGFKSYQADQFKSHSHTERHFSGDEDDKGGTHGADESLMTTYTGYSGGNESRPENIALKYIIKAE